MNRLSAALALLLLCHCAHGNALQLRAAQQGTPLSPQQAALCRAQLALGQVPLQRLALTAKTSRFGAEGRVRVSVQMVLQRPNQFRLTVLGPHGPPVYAAACDGAQLTSLDVGSKTFRNQPATAAGIAHQLGGLDLGLSAEDWLQLFLGEMQVPEDAVALQDPAAAAAAGTPQRQANACDGVLWRWRSLGRTLAAQYAGDTGMLRQAIITLGDGRIGTVTIKGRDPTGLPQQILLHLGASRGHNREAAQDVEITLADLQQLPAEIPAQGFVLAAPAAVPTL